MGFAREHWRPLTGAAGLHIGLLALLAFAAWQERIGDRLYDASVRSRLERLRARLTTV